RAVGRVGDEAVRPLPPEGTGCDRDAEREVAQARASGRAALGYQPLLAVSAPAADPSFGDLEVDPVDLEVLEEPLRPFPEPFAVLRARAAEIELARALRPRHDARLHFVVERVVLDAQDEPAVSMIGSDVG